MRLTLCAGGTGGGGGGTACVTPTLVILCVGHCLLLCVCDVVCEAIISIMSLLSCHFYHVISIMSFLSCHCCHVISNHVISLVSLMSCHSRMYHVTYLLHYTVSSIVSSVSVMSNIFVLFMVIVFWQFCHENSLILLLLTFSTIIFNLKLIYITIAQPSQDVLWC